MVYVSVTADVTKACMEVQGLSQSATAPLAPTSLRVSLVTTKGSTKMGAGCKTSKRTRILFMDG